MIDEKTVDTYLRAKKDQTAVNVLSVIAAALLCVLIIIEALGIEHDSTILLATASVVFMTASAGGNTWVKVNRIQLLQALERVISADACGLKILANKNRSNARLQS